MKFKFKKTGTILAGAFLFSLPALALDQIIYPYRTVRIGSMGGVKLTTGQYDENFYGNPARVTQDPIWRVQLPHIMAEVNSNVKDAVDAIGGAGGGTAGAIDAATGIQGKNVHARTQFTFPGVYFPNVGQSRFSFAIGVTTSVQTDLTLHRNYSVDPMTFVDAGPAFIFGAEFLDDNALSVGITPHLTSRAAASKPLGISELLNASDLGTGALLQFGTHFDMDFGTSYILPWKPAEVEFMGSVAVNNMLGGRYANVKAIKIPGVDALPKSQPRTLGFGFSAKKKTLWKFDDAVAALEFQDFFYDRRGSIWRMVHFGTEIKFGVLTPRFGINQGYFGGGLALDLWHFILEVGTYGEELTLNAGGQENRIYAAHIGFHI